jgi:hypothetical protein
MSAVSTWTRVKIDVATDNGFRVLEKHLMRCLHWRTSGPADDRE